MKKQVIGRILFILVFVLGGLGLVSIIGKEFAAKKLEKLRIYIAPSGMTLESRVNPPEGYTRVPAEAGSFTDFLRSYPMKEDGAKILRYDGSLERNQNLHIAVFAMPVGSENLQLFAILQKKMVQLRQHILMRMAMKFIRSNIV